MSRVKPVDQETVAALEDLFAPVVERMGFIPMSQQVMAHTGWSVGKHTTAE
jgi:hypothetical protein